MTDADQNAQSMFDNSFEGQPPHIVQNRDILEELDYGRTLRIWKLCHTIEDVLVKEYMDLLIKTKFFPKPPTPEELTTVSAVAPVLTCSKETQVKVLNIFSAFLSNTYHLDNVTNACGRNLPLFVPKAKFLVPNYSHLPLSYFTNLKELKEDFAKAVQLESIHAVKFTNELFLLKAFSQIKCDLSEQSVNNDHIKTEYCVLFSIACQNFKKEHKRKSIDWDQKESKVHGSLPAWRRKQHNPPSLVQNRYAEKISKAILGNKIDLSGSTAHQDLATFLSASIPPSSINTNNHPAPPPPPAPTYPDDQSRNPARRRRYTGNPTVTNKRNQDNAPGTMEYAKLFHKQQKRNVNPRVTKRRRLDEDAASNRNSNNYSSG